MAKHFNLKADTPTFTNSAPYGNSTVLLFRLGIKNGKLVGGKGAALANGDTVCFGVLPQGFEFIGTATVLKADGTGVGELGGTLGFEYIGGADDENLPQADNFFGNTAKYARFNKAAYLTVKLTAIADKDIVIALNGVLNGSL